MKHLFTRIAMAVLILSGTMYLTDAHADKIVMGSGDWCPYVCDPNVHDGKFGYLTEIAKIVFEKKGHEFVMEYMPFVRAVKLAREGSITGLVGVYKGDVPDFVFPEVNQGVGRNTFYSVTGNPWRYTGIDSLNTVKLLGTIKDYFYGDEITAFAKAHPDKVDELFGDKPQERSINKLNMGRISVWIEDNQVAKFNIKQMGLDKQLVPVGSIGDDLLVYIAFSPNVPKAKDYASLIVKGVDELRQSGELKRILSGYGLEDWENK